MWGQLAILFACLALWSTKISICFFILQLIRRTHKSMRYVAYALIAITSTTSTCQIILWALQARPLEKLWDFEVPGTIASKKQLVDSIITFTGTLPCRLRRLVSFNQFLTDKPIAINSITDLFYALAPIYFLARLQTSLKNKLMVAALTGSGLLYVNLHFSLSFIVILILTRCRHSVFAVSIIRVSFVNDFFDPDVTWALRKVYICTIVERNLANLIADLPAIFQLLRKKVVPMVSRLTTSKSNAYASGTGRPLGGPANSRYGALSGYGKHSQFSSTEQEYIPGSDESPDKRRRGSDDEIPLRDGIRRPDASYGVTDGKSINVKTQIQVRSEQVSDYTTSQNQAWQSGTYGPRQ